MPLNNVLIYLRFLHTVFLLSLTSLPHEVWVSILNTSHVTFSHVSVFGMNDGPKVCDKAKGFAVYLHVHIGFRAIKLLCEGYKIICRRRRDKPECDTLCVVQITHQKTCYMHALLQVSAQLRLCFPFSVLSFHFDSFNLIKDATHAHTHTHTMGYARKNVIGPRTSFVIASLPSSIHWNMCI